MLIETFKRHKKGRGRHKKKGPNTVLLKRGSVKKKIRTINALSRGKGKTRPTPVLIT